jgi:hypothetical protein
MGDLHGSSTEASEFLNHKDGARFSRACSKSADVPRQLALGALRSSINMRVPKKGFPCPVCPAALTTRKLLKNHLSKVHDGVTFSDEVYDKYAADCNGVVDERLAVCRAVNDVRGALQETMTAYNTTKRSHRSARAQRGSAAADVLSV